MTTHTPGDNAVPEQTLAAKPRTSPTVALTASQSERIGLIVAAEYHRVSSHATDEEWGSDELQRKLDELDALIFALEPNATTTPTNANPEAGRDLADDINRALDEWAYEAPAVNGTLMPCSEFIAAHLRARGWIKE